MKPITDTLIELAEIIAIASAMLVIAAGLAFIMSIIASILP